MSDKLKMHTPNKADENFAKLAALFPNAVTETKDENGDIVRAIDKDVLMQEISTTVVDGADERYQFTWPDKKKSILLANAPISKTLRPCKEESVDFDTTENLYIEGDNLEVLKLLQETYLGKIKMIYIDPPYNTGNDFVYEDDFEMSSSEWDKQSGELDENGMKLTHGTIEYLRDEKGKKKLVLNSNSNGRFHTDWLNMMYPRLKISKDLLTDDGVIFISIDDNEIHNLRKLCDEIFGEYNLIAEFAVASNSTKNNSKYVSVSHEYIACYARNKTALTTEWKVKKNGVDEYYNRAMNLVKSGLSSDEIHQELLSLVKYPRFYDLDHYTYADERGIYQTDNPGGVSNGNTETVVLHPITKKPCPIPNGGWRYKEAEIRRLEAENLFAFGEDETIIPRVKRYLNDYIYQVPKSVLFFDSQGSTKWLKNNGIPFDFSKAVDLMKYIISIGGKNDIILDFFSGSATTAHAIMQLNAEDDGNRKYICVQLPEKTDEKSEANKVGFKTICEIGKERIRRAAKKIADENPEAKFDGGFRVHKCDTSNMKDVYYNPSEFNPSFLDTMEDNIKEDRTPEDLLFQVMLDLGVLLSSKIEETTIAGKKVFNVADNFLIACFDKDVNDEVIKEIAQKKPYYFVMRDSSMENDSVATNFEQIFATFSPDTVRKVL